MIETEFKPGLPFPSFSVSFIVHTPPSRSPLRSALFWIGHSLCSRAAVEELPSLVNVGCPYTSFQLSHPPHKHPKAFCLTPGELGTYY